MPARVDLAPILICHRPLWTVLADPQQSPSAAKGVSGKIIERVDFMGPLCDQVKASAFKPTSYALDLGDSELDFNFPVGHPQQYRASLLPADEDVPDFALISVQSCGYGGSQKTRQGSLKTEISSETNRPLPTLVPWLRNP